MLFPFLARFERADHASRALFPIAYGIFLAYFFLLVKDEVSIPSDSPCAQI